MSFKVLTGQTTTAVLQGDGFWPDLPLSEFLELYRLPSEYAEALMVDHLGLARLWAVKELISYRTEKEEEGHSSLADVPIYGFAGEAERLFKRAVYCRAKALLLAQFATVERRDSAKNDAKESSEIADSFYAWAHQAIAALKGVTNVNVALV